VIGHGGGGRHRGRQKQGSSGGDQPVFKVSSREREGLSMSAAKFGSGATGSGDDGFDLSISDDGQAFTLTFAEIQAEVGGGKSPDMVAARVFSAVLPVDGGDNGVDISFTTQGFAIATEGANAYAVLSVNGQTSVQHFPAGTDQSFMQQLSFKGGPTSQCHLAVVAVVQRDPAHPDAAATLRPSSVDAEIQPPGGS
jgi:hypothetical protein